MPTKIKQSGILSAFVLKIFACVFMFVDHFGVAIFPQHEIFRIIGRLAFPIFAFFISEGCYYTKNRLKRFLSVAVLGVVCETVYIIYDGQFYGNILLTFSLSILLIYLLDEIKKSIFSKRTDKTVLFSVLFLSLTVFAYIVKSHLDYGFFGILTPVFLSFCDYKEGSHPQYFKYLFNKTTRLAVFAFALVLVSMQETAMNIQILALLSLIPLALYNGKIGRYKLKYAFYLFYPLHLLLIQGISMLVK